MREFRSSGSVRGALENGRPYREHFVETSGKSGGVALFDPRARKKTSAAMGGNRTTAAARGELPAMSAMRSPRATEIRSSLRNSRFVQTLGHARKQIAILAELHSR